jgi:hypothetical protein
MHTDSGPGRTVPMCSTHDGGASPMLTRTCTLRRAQSPSAVDTPLHLTLGTRDTELVPHRRWPSTAGSSVTNRVTQRGSNGW